MDWYTGPRVKPSKLYCRDSVLQFTCRDLTCTPWFQHAISHRSHAMQGVSKQLSRRDEVSVEVPELWQMHGQKRPLPSSPPNALLAHSSAWTSYTHPLPATSDLSPAPDAGIWGLFSDCGNLCSQVQPLCYWQWCPALPPPSLWVSSLS